MPTWVVQLIWWVVTSASSYFISRPEKQPPPEVGDIEMPTAADGREKPVLFGTRDLDASHINTLWWGDVKTRPHKVSQGKK